MTLDLASMLRRTIDPRTGIATRLWEVTADPMAPDLFVAVAAGSPASYFIDNETARWGNSSSGSGAAFTREQSLWAAIGETVERYSASIYDRATLIESDECSLPGPALEMSRIIAYSDQQYDSPGFSFRKYDPTARIDWFSGRNVHDASPTFAPAQFVFLSSEWAGERSLGPSVSTGLACHSDPTRATASGLLELIERDGFASAWLLRFTPPRLVLESQTIAVLSAACRSALTNDRLPITLQFVPNEFGLATVIASAEHPEFGFGVVGAATRSTLPAAIEKAVIEALHGWAGAVTSRRQAEIIPDTAGVLTPHHHAMFHLDPANWERAAWFRSPTQDVSSTEVEQSCGHSDLTSLVATMIDRGFAVSVYDVTSPDIQALGFHVHRVLAPGLQPLTFGQAPLPGDLRRLKQHAELWHIEMPAGLNDQVHPFP